MDGETASLAFAMLTGNSGFLDEEILQNYRYGGIAHIFAVSGLHIGIIYGILSLVLRKLRLRAPVRIPLIAAALTFYAGVCGFSPSSLRAVVMCIVPMLAEAFGSECDRLNSVSLAASAVLFINPVYLFSIGFQLSLAATAGIILLGGRLSRLASRVRFLPQKISSALCISFSAQVFTLPILLDSFGYISGLSLLLNLLFIPVFSAVFSLLFVFTVLSCILPFASEVLLWLPGNLLRLSVLPVSAFEFDVLLISGFSFGALAVLWYLLCWLNTDKINLKAVPKACLSVLLCIALTLGMVFRNGTFFYDALISAHSYYGSNIVIVRREGRTSLIATGIPDGEYLETLFLRERITSLDAVAVLGSSVGNKHCRSGHPSQCILPYTLGPGFLWVTGCIFFGGNREDGRNFFLRRDICFLCRRRNALSQPVRCVVHRFRFLCRRRSPSVQRSYSRRTRRCAL